MLGYYAAKRLGVGQQVFVDMMGANAYANHDDAIWYEGKPPRPPIDADVYGTSALYRLYRARTGWVFLAVVTDEEWRACCAEAHPALEADPRFATAEARRDHDADLAEALAACFATDDADAWEARLIPHGVGCVRADGQSVGSFWLNDPHVLANDLAPEAEHDIWGTYRRHGPHVKLHRTPGDLRGGSLGGDSTDALLAELGYDAATIADYRTRGLVAGPMTT